MLWCVLFMFLIFKKQQKKSQTLSDKSSPEDQLPTTVEVNPNLYELQIPDSPGQVKPRKLKIVPKQKPKTPKNRDFSVQANGLNNQSNQTESYEDEAWREEMKELRGKIEALKAPSKIPRKNGTSNLFHQNDFQRSHSFESVGIQSLTTSSSR